MTSYLPVKLQPYISDSTSRLIHQAYQIMQGSKDPFHDHTHVNRMLKDFEQFVLHEKELHKVNPEILILSVVWHDTWKAGRIAKNPLELLVHQIWDGLGSVALFEQAAKQGRLPREVTQQVSYAIRKHAQFQLLPLKTWEAKVLQDLDNLDLWSTERFALGKDLFIFKSPLKVKFFLKAIELQSPFTDWATQELLPRRLALHAAAQKLLNDLNGSTL